MTEHKKHTKENLGTEGQAAEEKEKPAAEQPPEEGLDALQGELEQAKAQAAEYLDGWKRAQAELINSRKRLERDAAEARIQTTGRSASRWFPILDDFERALKERPGPDTFDQWIAGVELIYRKGLAALETEGVTPIEPQTGTEFDPNEQEAITLEPCPDRKDGEILEVVCRGYRLGERVLRPAQVRVACKPTANG